MSEDQKLSANNPDHHSELQKQWWEMNDRHVDEMSNYLIGNDLMMGGPTLTYQALEEYCVKFISKVMNKCGDEAEARLEKMSPPEQEEEQEDDA